MWLLLSSQSWTPVRWSAREKQWIALHIWIHDPLVDLSTGGFKSVLASEYICQLDKSIVKPTCWPPAPCERENVVSPLGKEVGWNDERQVRASDSSSWSNPESNAWCRRNRLGIKGAMPLVVQLETCRQIIIPCIVIWCSMNLTNVGWTLTVH